MVVLVWLVAVVGLSGCTDGDAASGDRPGPDATPTITTTIPPLGMILRPVADGRAEVRVLLGPGDSPHTYEPTPSDVRSVSGSLMLVHVNRHLDGWVTTLPAARVVPLAPLLPATQRLPMPPADGTDDGGPRAAEHEHGDHAHEHGDTDPHFWTSPQAVRGVLPALVDTLCAADPAGCTTYRANADSLSTDLQAIDVQIDAMLRPVRGRSVALSQPFFRYFLSAYGVRVTHIIEPRPAKEPSPRQIARQIQSIREEGVPVIFTQAQLPDRSARAVADGAGIPTHSLDPIGGVPGRSTYRDLLLFNAEQILDAIGPEPAPSASR
jgi:ABC-type Zn uptake system ZnuABC Zn-binding protein ZnuA